MHRTASGGGDLASERGPSDLPHAEQADHRAASDARLDAPVQPPAGESAQFTTVQHWPSRPTALAAAGSAIDPFVSAPRAAPGSGALADPE